MEFGIKRYTTFFLNRWQKGLLVWTFLLATLRVVCLADSPSMNSSPESIDAMYLTYSKDFSDVKEISVHDLVRQESPDFVLVDIRSPEERAVSSIPGSITRAEFEGDPDWFTRQGDRSILHDWLSQRSVRPEIAAAGPRHSQPSRWIAGMVPCGAACCCSKRTYTSCTRLWTKVESVAGTVPRSLVAKNQRFRRHPEFAG